MVFFERQVAQFASVRERINGILGAKADTFFSKSLFLISVGSNDLFDFARNESGSIRLGAEQYLALIQVTYYSHLKVKLSYRPIGICGRRHGWLISLCIEVKFAEALRVGR